MIKKILKIKPMKIFLCFIENVIKSISLKLWKLIEKKLYNPYNFGEQNIEYTKGLYNKIKSILEKNNFIIKNINFLELGPGGFLGVGAYMKNEGIKKYYVIDEINHFEKLDNKTVSLYNKIDKNFLDGDTFDNEFVKVLQYNNGIPIEKNQIDLIFSQSVYEHVKNPEDSIKELSRITKKGGINIHHIDFKDHIYDKSSLWFLAFSSKLFDILFYNSGAWVNRKRYSDFIKYFELNNFEILDIITMSEHEDKVIEKNTKLLKKYSKEDLKKGGVTFVVRKI